MSRFKLYGILTLLGIAVGYSSFGQDKIITGTVTNEIGLPLPGVTVTVEGTINSTQTNFDGKYTIRANPGQTLLFTYPGQKFKRRTIGVASSITIQTEEDTHTLKEVIVTAQGIKREKRSLGYAVATLHEEQVSSRPTADIGRVLQGKVSGVAVTATNGLSGSSTNIIIRGYSSVTQSNQPLFVVDGVPIDSGTNIQTSYLDGNTESSRFLDIDPNNIANISVLKGLSATILYGNRGRNGVILITTKGAITNVTVHKTEITVTQSTFTSEAILPKYQNKYGVGAYQKFGLFVSNWGPRFDRTDDDGIAQSSQFLGNENGFALLQHPLNFLSDATLTTGFEELLQQPYEYRPYHSVEDFFRTGYITSTSVNIRNGGEKTSFNMNYGRTEDIGITPGNQLLRNNFSLGGSTKLSNNLTANGVFNFIRTETKSPPNAVSTGNGAAFRGSAIFGDLLYTPRSIDLTNLPFQTIDGRSVYYRSRNDIQNPYWTVANVKTTQDTDRFLGTMALTYTFTDAVNFTYRLGLDTYTEFNFYGQNRGGVDGPIQGLLRTSYIKNTIWNHDLILSANKDISDVFNLKAIAGANSRRDVYSQDGIESTGQKTFDVLEHHEFDTSSPTNSFIRNGNANLNQNFEENLVGLYLDITLSYKDFLFLNAVGRKDWSSTLERENNSIFYPGASVAFIPTSAFENIQSNFLNYTKVRVGYGSSAGFPEPFKTRNVLSFITRNLVDLNGNSIQSNTVSDILGNPNLKPERIEEYEIGVDTRLFNRLNANISIFKKITTDLITDRTLDSSTGFQSTVANIGEVQSKGIEIDFDFDILKEHKNKIGFNIAGNFTAIETTVTNLAEGTDNILLTDAVIGGAANYAVKGRPFGVLLGSTIQKDENGNRIVGSDGTYEIDNTLTEIGDPNPDWTSALIPTLRFKNFTLSANLQYRHGGDIYSLTTATLIGRGVVDTDTPIDRESQYILPGVTSNGTPNTTAISATELAFETYLAGPNELQIYDGSTLRLQEASLQYTVPAKVLEKTPFGNLSFILSGQNLWYKAINFPDNVRYDVNASSTGVGNGQGIDYITGPSSRKYGFTVKATF